MTERKELSTKDKLLLAGGALTVAAGGVVLGSGFISQREGQRQVDPSKNQTAEATATPYDQLLRPITPTEAAVIAAATKTPEATQPPATATETQVPPTATGTATREPSATAKPTTEPTKEAEKPPLPEYAVFTGPLLNKETKAPMGTIIVSQLPKPVNQILIFFVVQRSGRPFLISPKYIVGRTVFENAERRYEYVRIDASKPGVIFGALEGGNTHMTFTAPLGGEGRDTLIQTYKQTEIKEYNRPGITDQIVIKELAQEGIILP